MNRTCTDPVKFIAFTMDSATVLMLTSSFSPTLNHANEHSRVDTNQREWLARCSHTRAMSKWTASPNHWRKWIDEEECRCQVPQTACRHAWPQSTYESNQESHETPPANNCQTDRKHWWEWRRWSYTHTDPCTLYRIQAKMREIRWLREYETCFARQSCVLHTRIQSWIHAVVRRAPSSHQWDSCGLSAVKWLLERSNLWQWG